MEIIATSVHLIDYENGEIRTITPPEAFGEYVSGLIGDINSNTTVREFMTLSVRTEVINAILDTQAHINNPQTIQDNANIIAMRLLNKETAAQQRIEHLEIQVQKGSLVQAYISDEQTENKTYLLAKVEHGGFVDDIDFSFKSGFSKDKKTVWKTCIFDLTNASNGCYNAKVYSNTAAKYWWSDFLELTPVIDDERNTQVAFKAIDHELYSIIKRNAPFDHTVLRNAFVSKFKRSEHPDYDSMIHEIMDNYTPSDLSTDELSNLRDKLLELPDVRKFDRQFTPVPSVIKARIKREYDVYQGIKLQITDEIDKIEEVIYSERDEHGTQYLKIRTTDNVTFKRFFKRKEK